VRRRRAGCTNDIAAFAAGFAGKTTPVMRDAGAWRFQREAPMNASLPIVPEMARV
jgi:hypothetical protein